MKFWTTLSLSLISFSWCYSEPQTSGPNTIRVFELDGSPDGRIRNISLSGCSLVIDGSTAVITCTGTGGGGDNFGSHVATMAANFQGQFAIIGATSIVASSVTAWVSMTSSNGFQGGISSFTSINLSSGNAGHPAITFSTGAYTTGIFGSENGNFIGFVIFGTTSTGLQEVPLLRISSTSAGGVVQVGNINGVPNNNQFIANGGFEGRPGLTMQNGNTMGFWTTTGGGWFFTNGGLANSVIRLPSFGNIQLGKIKGNNPAGSVVISTNGANVPILVVTSETAKFSVSGASVTSRVVFAVIPSSSNAFSDNPSSYSFVVSSPVTLGQTVATEKFAFNVATTTHINSNGVSPALTNCGNSPTVFGSDNAFTITVGATAGGCTATFAQAFFNTPTCTISPQTGSVVNTISYTVSNSQVVITETGISGNVDVHCIGHD